MREGVESKQRDSFLLAFLLAFACSLACLLTVVAPCLMSSKRKSFNPPGGASRTHRQTDGLKDTDKQTLTHSHTESHRHPPTHPGRSSFSDSLIIFYFIPAELRATHFSPPQMMIFCVCRPTKDYGSNPRNDPLSNNSQCGRFAQLRVNQFFGKLFFSIST